MNDYRLSIIMLSGKMKRKACCFADETRHFGKIKKSKFYEIIIQKDGKKLQPSLTYQQFW